MVVRLQYQIHLVGRADSAKPLGKLLPASMLMGGTFLLVVDDVSRLATAAEIPIGILTAFIGAPFFLYLITRNKKL